MFVDVELWSEIRRRVLTREISKREACRIYELHWATLKKILAHEEPPGYERKRPIHRPKIEPVLPIIRQILDEDVTAPRKQRRIASGSGCGTSMGSPVATPWCEPRCER